MRDTGSFPATPDMANGKNAYVNTAFDSNGDIGHSSKSERKKKGMDLLFSDVHVSINKTPILKDVSGMAKQGDMLAVMGPSGAGKSTLLNAISGRMVADSGSILLNGDPIKRQNRRKICYVLQHDIFFANLTLKETLTFTAMLRLPEKMPRRLKAKRVEEIIEILELDKCVNTVMGGMFMPGLSGGEKKRASIGCELLTNPYLMLLDEPTSGLDSAIAFSLMQTLKNYTRQSNKTVVTTIHQPSSQVFHMFDNVLLLANGQVAYFGETSKVLEFFSSIGLKSAPNYNPADFILEKVKESEDVLERILEGTEAQRNGPNWPKELQKLTKRETESGATGNGDDVQVKANGAMANHVPEPEVKVVENESDLYTKVNGVMPNESIGMHKHSQVTFHADVEAGIQAIAYVKKDPDDDFEVTVLDRNDRKSLMLESSDIDRYYVADSKFQAGFWTQYSTLVSRTFLQAKGRILSKLNFIQTFILAIFCGILWWQTPRTEQTLNDRMGLIFFNVVYFGFFCMFDAITSFPEERGVINKERASGSYRLSAYYLSKMTAESPLIFTLPVIYTTITYWMGGLVPDAGNFFAYLALILLLALTAQSIGIFVGVTFLDFKMSITVGSSFMLISLLAGGYYQTHFPTWLVWARYLSFLHYAYQSLLKLEFIHGPPIACNPPETSIFIECAQNTTTAITGEYFLETQGHTFPIYMDILVLFGFIFLFRFVGYIILRYLRRPG